VQSWRVLLQDVAIDEVGITTDYADLFVVVREGSEGAGPNDWEATVRTAERQHLRPGRYALRATTADDIPVAGAALLRFSDGHRHLFRGDGDLEGVDAVTAS
jgi:hypothetical protein